MTFMMRMYLYTFFEYIVWSVCDQQLIWRDARTSQAYGYVIDTDIYIYIFINREA
jgi:hypothetical protein